ncbi:MAG: glycoside hydrolase family 25 protein [Sphingomonadaceae bacterium]|nr:glycoside hydrolase family 25 protein [Sphingomonadaceae bacterium]
MARKGRSTRLRLMAAVVLVALIAGGYGWWHLRHWQPSRAEFPVQGVEIGFADGEVNWRALKAIGANFAYLDASASVFARDPAFGENLKQAKAAGMKVGAVHLYDPCQPADKQAGNFVVVVPRDRKMLPPAVEFTGDADDCPVKTSDAEVESELMTFLNQIETHTGMPTILKLGPGFEARYAMASRIDRILWLTRSRLQPDYAGRPWTLWTANSGLMTDVTAGELRWVVVQP